MKNVLLIIPLLLSMSCTFMGKSIERRSQIDFVNTSNMSMDNKKKYNDKKLKEYHISKGETLYRISKNFNIPIEDLAQINNIKDATKIFVGQIIKVPITGNKKTKDILPKNSVAIHSNNVNFLNLWPLKNTSRNSIDKKFGRIFDSKLKVFTTNNGLDIKMNNDNHIYASANGKVTYINFVKGVGKIIGVKLKGNYYLFYYPFDKISVKKGDMVKAGNELGTLNGDVLHFEVRKGKQPLNPLLFLP